MISIEAQLSLALEENKSLKLALHIARVAKARSEREMRLRNSGLPEQARDRLHMAFAKSTDNAGLKEAINVELRRGAQ